MHTQYHVCMRRSLPVFVGVRMYVQPCQVIYDSHLGILVRLHWVLNCLNHPPCVDQRY